MGKAARLGRVEDGHGDDGQGRDRDEHCPERRHFHAEVVEVEQGQRAEGEQDVTGDPSPRAQRKPGEEQDAASAEG